MQLVFCEPLVVPAAHSAIEGDGIILKSCVTGLTYVEDQLSFQCSKPGSCNGNKSS